MSSSARAAEDEFESLERRSSAFRQDLLVGRVALVSGGGGGIGKATAWTLAKLGARVVICGRNGDKLERVAQAAARIGREIQYVTMDIRDLAAVHALFDRLAQTHGGIDLLINSAGGQFGKPAIDLSANGWRSVIDTNLNGTWNMMQTAAQRWRDCDAEGSIVNIVASVERGMLGAAHSCAARAGVIYMSKTVAVEWAPLKIRVNCIAPGTILTDGMRNYPDQVRESFRRSNPMMRLGDPADIAEACIYVGASPGAFITGELLTIDGGAQVWGEIWTTEKPAYFGATTWPERP